MRNSANSRRFPWRLALALIVAASFSEDGRGQLAITEVMSAATTVSTNTGLRRSDYWELTNFGTNDLNLQGYGFRDSDPNRSLVKYPFTNLVIHAGESVIFFQVDDDSAITNVEQFQAWWGASKLPTNLQCRIWADKPGLSGWDGDAVWLFNAAGEVVDGVVFGRTAPGRAFTHEPTTGIFGVLSVAGVNGAFTAELAADIGSPGTSTGPVPSYFLQPPSDQFADAGMEVSFATVVAGLPRPHCQWFAHGWAIPNGTNATLVLSNVQPADAGEYFAVITNSLSAVTSAVVTLTVSTNLSPPVVVRPPADAVVFSRQTAVFTVAARGFPAPSYQWTSNGVDISGATSPTLSIADVSEVLSGTRYGVRIENALGSTNAVAVLTVTRRPDLRFTEVMALPANEEHNRHFDWFEVTNFDTNAVNLWGWRFADTPSFARAITITNTLILLPGESAVFAERLDGPWFAAWWGTDNLPAGLKLFPYSGWGLAYLGETLYLWNPAATDPYDYLATVSWAAATPGVSFECEHWCDPEGYGCLDEAIADSVLGQRGAFRAVDGGDIGSPGCVANPPVQILSVCREVVGQLALRCRVVPGKSYRLRRAASLAGSTWMSLEVHAATNNVLTLSDQFPGAGSAWFYRVEEMP